MQPSCADARSAGRASRRAAAHLIVACAPMAAPSSREWKHSATPISTAVRKETLRRPAPAPAAPGASIGFAGGGSTSNTKLSVLSLCGEARRCTPLMLLPSSFSGSSRPCGGLLPPSERAYKLLLPLCWPASLPLRGAEQSSKPCASASLLLCFSVKRAGSARPRSAISMPARRTTANSVPGKKTCGWVR